MLRWLGFTNPTCSLITQNQLTLIKMPSAPLTRPQLRLRHSTRRLRKSSPRSSLSTRTLRVCASSSR
jgi:hypothetical protein